MFSFKLRPRLLLLVGNHASKVKIEQSRNHIKICQSLLSTLTNHNHLKMKPNSSSLKFEKNIFLKEIEYKKLFHKYKNDGHIDKAVSLVEYFIENKMIKLNNSENLTFLRIFDGILLNCSMKGHLSLALKVLELMASIDMEPNLKFYNSALGCCVKQKHGGAHEMALDIIDLMKSSQCQPNVASYTSLLQCYGNSSMFKVCRLHIFI